MLNTKPELRVKRFTLQPMPPSEQQYRRSLTVQLRGEDTDNLLLASKVLAEHHENKSFGEAIPLDTIVPSLHHFASLTPKGAAVGMWAGKLQSWGEEMMSFVLEVEAHYVHGRSVTTHVIAGYTTNKPVFKEDGTPEDFLEFRINSVHDYRTSSAETPAGLHSHTNFYNAAQVLSDIDYAGLTTKHALHNLRPEEVIMTMDRLSMPELLSGGVVTDLRTMQSHMPKFAAYQHNDPTLWAERLLEINVRTKFCQKQGLLNSESPYDIHAHMASEARAVSPMNHIFFHTLSRMTGSGYSAIFSLKDLKMIDPTCMEKFSVLPNPEVRKLYNRKSFEGDDQNTFSCSYIANSVPAIMSKHNVRVAEFGARNFFNPAKLWSTDVEPIFGELTPDQITDFLNEVRTRVFDVISYNNARSYMFGGTFDLFGISAFGMEMDREGTMGFASPTFANNLFSPQITADMEEQNRIATTVEMVYDLYNETL
jgi:hypothetical protein